MAIELQGKRGGQGVANVPMAPMIDMVFLLLVFFMTASAMSQAGNKLELDLPESPHSRVAEDFKGRFVVSVDSEGSYYLGTRTVTLEDLSESLEAFREETEGAAKVSIRASEDTPYAAVRSVMQAAAEAGIQNYLYATYEVGAE